MKTPRRSGLYLSDVSRAFIDARRGGDGSLSGAVNASLARYDEALRATLRTTTIPPVTWLQWIMNQSAYHRDRMARAERDPHAGVAAVMVDLAYADLYDRYWAGSPGDRRLMCQGLSRLRRIAPELFEPRP